MAEVLQQNGSQPISYQGKVIGVIIPPPEIKAVVEKTAQFVARNGKSFEQRILSSGEGKSAKFDFMKQTNPYNAYYEQKIREFEENINNGYTAPTNGSADNRPDQTNNNTPMNEKKEALDKTTAHKDQNINPYQILTIVNKASIVNPIAKILKNLPDDPPQPFEFSMGQPSGISALDIDIMKLTAQYTSVNGRDFLVGLVQREQRNPQFDFLKPTHMLFSYFTSLVDSYSKIVQANADLMNKITNRTDRNKALELSVHRWQHKRQEDDRKRHESHEADEERLAFQAIDWFDFTVVEFIDFPEDELLDIPGIQSLAVVDKQNEGQQKGRSSAKDEVTHPSLRTNSIPPPPPPTLPTRMGMPQPPPHPHEFGFHSTMPPKPPGLQPSFGSRPQSNLDDDGDEPLNIVADYHPRIASNVENKGSGSAVSMMIDPISGKAVPVDKLEEHMRVQLLDPKWRQEQKRFEEKLKDTGLAAGSSIADSLKLFAKKRGDIFGQAADGSGEDSAMVIAEEEAKEKLREEELSQVQWDGHQGSIPLVQRMKSDQASIYQSSSYNPPPSHSGPSIGPSMTSMAPPYGHVPSAPSMAPPPPPTYIPSMPPTAPIPSYFPPIPPMLSAMPMPPLMTHPIPIPTNSYMMPPPPPLGFVANDSQPTKKSKLDEAESLLISAEQFSAQHPGPIALKIQLPVDSAWNLNGTTLDITVPSIQCSIKELKDMLSLSPSLGGMPASKQQLKAPGHGFLKDASTLAALNIAPGSVLELSSKSRGGKR